MAYSETKVVIGGLAHVPILIFIINLIKGQFANKAGDLQGVEFKDEETNIKQTTLKKEEIKPENEKKSAVDEIVVSEEEKQEDVEKSESKEVLVSEEEKQGDEEKS
tara:strand:+ start:280 stop:597 length:318 start_codon:yes stop_codon:yes gene_type:complete